MMDASSCHFTLFGAFGGLCSTKCPFLGVPIFTLGPRHPETYLLGMHGQQRSRSDCASGQSDQSLNCPLTKSSNTTEFMNEQSPDDTLRMRRMI